MRTSGIERRRQMILRELHTCFREPYQRRKVQKKESQERTSLAREQGVRRGERDWAIDRRERETHGTGPIEQKFSSSARRPP